MRLRLWKKRNIISRSKRVRMACEPAPAYRTTVTEPVAHSVGKESELPTSEFFSFENLEQSINDFMETKDDPSQWLSWNQVESHLLEEYPWLK